MKQNAFHRLKAQVTEESTREYRARGIQVKRCPVCQINPDFCICDDAPAQKSNIDFILLFHRDEIFKPTNTGRLIADTFPDNTFAYCWNRKSPDGSLLALLQDPERDCYLIFPAEETDDRHLVNEPTMPSPKRVTFILLDATWRQGRRMFNFSQWMKEIPVLRISPEASAEYTSRKAHKEDYLSTAESAVCALKLAGEPQQADLLFDYFDLFNQRYSAMRSNHQKSKSGRES